MKIVRSINELQKLTRQMSKTKRIGVVPTMGFLHDGHLSLIRRAKKLSDVVITTIFVNPTQFAPGEDLEKYPRDEKGDIAKIKSVGGDIVFIPKMETVYPDDFQTYVNVEKLTQSLEGEKRPAHFRGVTTIVTKLFNMIRPDIAVFGMKDYQQAAVIKQMARDLNFPVKIFIASTVREKNGLAMSSRNKYFNAEQRKEAVCLFQALMTAKRMVKEGEINCLKIKTKMKSVIKKFCPSAEIDYIAFTNFDTLKPVKQIGKKNVCSLAVRLHGVRLIDNMKLK
ncbi:MAG: pantoate--beta-alanine ligase [Candidatus Zixiibacteriota bacterium]